MKVVVFKFSKFEVFNVVLVVVDGGFIIEVIKLKKKLLVKKVVKVVELVL